MFEKCRKEINKSYIVIMINLHQNVKKYLERRMLYVSSL